MAPKSTGWRSTNSHAFGHCESIAEQLTLPDRPITKRMVMAALISEMVEDDAWEMVPHPLFRHPVPKDWSQADAAHANAFVDKCHAFSDLHGLWLKEYDDTGAVVKMKYGKPWRET